MMLLIDGLISDQRKYGEKRKRTKHAFRYPRLENQRILLNYVPVSQDEALDPAR